MSGQGLEHLNKLGHAFGILSNGKRVGVVTGRRHTEQRVGYTHTVLGREVELREMMATVPVPNQNAVGRHQRREIARRGDEGDG